MIAPAPLTAGVLDENANGIRMTPEEFDAVEDFDPQFRYELVEGIVIVSPAPDISERSPNDELGYLLRRYQNEHPQGRVIDDTAFEQYIRVQNGRRLADRPIWTGLGRKPDVKTDMPTVAVEFVGKRRRDWRRDHVDKRHEYAAAGVDEYWVIDRFRRIMTVCCGESEVIVIESGATYTTHRLPGFELPLDRLLAASDPYTE
jgi:Uma2 family endonuclease